MNNKRLHNLKLPSGLNLKCNHGENLREALLGHFQEIYHPVAKWIHCRGLGTCGTCAVKVQGHLSEPTRVEKWRLNFPPHKPHSQLRLACQARVEGDLVIEKGEGLWGQKI